VVVVEGFFDCLKVYQAGIRSVVALMGVALYSAPYRALIERFQHIVLMLDGDKAGHIAGKTIADRLRTWCTVQLVRDVQPDQLSEEAICYILQTTLPDRGSAG
jgi:DNA primase